MQKREGCREPGYWLRPEMKPSKSAAYPIPMMLFMYQSSR
jgi:hypothetical protein